MVCPGELGAAPCSAGGGCSMESAGLLGASCCSGFLFLLIFTAAVTFLIESRVLKSPTIIISPFSVRIASYILILSESMFLIVM